MNILVIGGSGLFGGKTVLHLARDGEVSRVVSFDVVPPRDWIVKSLGDHAGKFSFVRGDVSRLEDLLSTIKAHSIDRIVNLAFILPGDVEANPRLSVLVNQLGMCNSFEAARLMGINRVVYASSEGVYGPQDEYGDRDVTEDDELHPQSAYAIAKQLSEILAERYTGLYDLKMTAIRPPIGYGHGGKIPNVIRWFSEIVSLPAVGLPFSISADGTGLHSLASADDVAAFITILIKQPSSPHSAYNIGGPPLTLRDVAAAVRRYIPEARIEFGKEPQQLDSARGGIPWRLSMARAEADFGFTCMPLEKAVLTHINDARLDAGLEPIFERKETP
ncbi:MAG: NAD(P)-dependent oxidoreductase [Dehalococcoidales bacterium]|nr:NAD(P)-dependent oxidoreductase [Dehalococcoidales bacterium]